MQNGCPDSAVKAPCPHCGSHSVHRHGTFSLKDGSRQQRYLCQSCHRSFQQYTGTPLNYLKKRDRWSRHVRSMVKRLSLRRTAVILGVHLSTAFRWRHRLLSALVIPSGPPLMGSVAASEVFVRYSEKGSRRSGHPSPPRSTSGPLKGGVSPAKRPFRRFVDGRPSCVLFMSTDAQHEVSIIGRGRPKDELLQSSLAEFLGAVTELWAGDLAPFAPVCERLGIQYRNRCIPSQRTHCCQAVDLRVSQFDGWLHRFYGVATRYLENYLLWYRCAIGPDREQPANSIAKVLLDASYQRSARRTA